MAYECNEIESGVLLRVIPYFVDLQDAICVSESGSKKLKGDNSFDYQKVGLVLISRFV